MHSETSRTVSTRTATIAGPDINRSRSPGAGPHDGVNVEQAANCALDDCIFALGQAVGTRTTLDYEAVIWIRQHFHAKFARAIRAFGDRWAEDRDNVTGAAIMLGERAVRYAAHLPSIGLVAIQKAAADVERYCQLHSLRAARAHGLDASTTDQPLIAGYWCI